MYVHAESIVYGKCSEGKYFIVGSATSFKVEVLIAIRFFFFVTFALFVYIQRGKGMSFVCIRARAVVSGGIIHCVQHLTLGLFYYSHSPEGAFQRSLFDLSNCSLLIAVWRIRRRETISHFLSICFPVDC